IIVIIFFFFQAEDGIRDRNVTGVQTCALPISTMGGKDFGEYTNYINSAFATVGTRNISKGSDYPHHHACFNVVEESLKVSAELYAQYALSYIYIKMNFN